MNYDEHRTMDAWTDFVGGKAAGDRQRAVVRSLIQNSWRRSLDGGIDAHGSAAPINSDREEIDHLIRANADLIAAARPCFAAVSRMVEGTGAMIVLTNRDGVLVEALGDKATLTAGADIHLTVGGRWDECSVGTNGIGTALAAGEPVFVHAAEHFCEGIKGWTCAGAPIRDPLDGEVVGVFDLSGYSPIFRPHNAIFVAAIAREIEQELAQRQREERTRLLEAFIANSPGYMSRDGLVIVDRRGRATYVNNMIAPSGENGDRAQLVDCGHKILEGPLTDLTKAPGSTFPDALLRLCHFSPLRLDGEIRGAALVFPFSAAAARPARQSPAPARLERPAERIVGECEALRAAVDTARRVARSAPEIALLIEGETGVGKELMARHVHEASRRRGEFVAVNCGAIPEGLFVAELFGHERGAFTNARAEGAPGLARQADRGTLFLDEVSDIPLATQTALLRFLDNGEVRPVGGRAEVNVDVQIVSATNRSLADRVAARQFREDLMYRLNAFTIELPPLRARTDFADIARRLVADLAPRTTLTDAAIAVLVRRPWPGNIRELRHALQRALLRCRGETIDADVLDDCAADQVERACPSCRDSAIDRRFCEEIEAAHRLTGGNVTETAHRLGLSRTTVYKHLRR